MSKITLGLLALLCMLSLKTATAQESVSKTPRFTKSLKLHYRLPTPGVYTPNTSRKLGSFLPALELASASGNFHEIGFNGFTRSSYSNQLLNSSGSVFAGIGLRYDYAYKLFKQKDLGRFKLYAGFGIAQDFAHSRSFGVSRDEVLLAYNAHTTSLEFVPRIRYDLSKRFSLEASMPINILALSTSRFKDFPPEMEGVTRTYTSSSISSAPFSPQFKLGLVFRF